MLFMFCYCHLGPKQLEALQNGLPQHLSPPAPAPGFQDDRLIIESLAQLHYSRTLVEIYFTNFKPWILKRIVDNFFSFVKSHILGYDGVWYSSFWSEGSRNNIN